MNTLASNGEIGDPCFKDDYAIIVSQIMPLELSALRLVLA